MNGIGSVVHPLTDDALGNSSYLVEVGDRSAIVIDPRRDIEDYLALAERLRVRIVAVFESHLHADFVSGVREIAQVTGAEIYAPEGARLGFTHTPLSPAERVEIAGAAIEAIETPGHTSEHLSYLLGVNATTALFSGGSLIVGGAARTDLSGLDRTEAFARAQFASLRRLASLPDDTPLYPTHGGGSFCSTGLARSTSSTIGAERDTNSLFGIEDEDEFVEHLVSGFGTYPRYFLQLRDVNRLGAPLLRDLPVVRELTGAQARRAVEEGAAFIDGRTVEAWSQAHPEGAVSIELRDAFASWLGWAVPFGAPVVLVLEPKQVAEATRLARRIGYDRIDGWLTFDMWRAAGLPVSSLELVHPDEATQRQRHGAVLLDVRQDVEYAAGHIVGATHLELGDIIAGKTPDAADLITYCGHGERSATAASLLARRGLRVANLRGGTNAWRRQGCPFGT